MTEDDLVICDGEGPVASAGVMGGGDSEIAAGHDARAARVRVLRSARGATSRAAARAAHRVEPSLRARRGLGRHGVGPRARRVAHVQARRGGRGRRVAHLRGAGHPANDVTLRHEKVAGWLGVDIPHGDGHATSGRLGFACARPSRAWTSGRCRAFVRTCRARSTWSRRSRACAASTPSRPRCRPSEPTRDEGPRQLLARRARGAGVAMGLSEAITPGLRVAVRPRGRGRRRPEVTLQNPLGERGQRHAHQPAPGAPAGPSGTRSATASATRGSSRWGPRSWLRTSRTRSCP